MENGFCWCALAMKKRTGGQASVVRARSPIPGVGRGWEGAGLPDWQHLWFRKVTAPYLAGTVPCLWADVMTQLLSSGGEKEHRGPGEGALLCVAGEGPLGHGHSWLCTRRQPTQRRVLWAWQGCWMCSGWAVLGRAFQTIVSVPCFPWKYPEVSFSKAGTRWALWEGL